MLSAVSGAAEFELTGDERDRLVGWSRGGSSRLAVRARIVLALAEPAAVQARVAADLGVTAATVTKWRKRFEVSRVAGLIDGERPGRPKADLVLTADERDQLPAVVAAGEVGAGVGVAGADRLGLRGTGATNKQVAADLRVIGAHGRQVAAPVRRPRAWTGWSMSLARGGRRRSCWTRSKRWWWRRWRRRPANATHWSRTSMAKRAGLSPSTVGRIWRRFDLKPHLVDGFKLSTDPQFVDKVVDVVGLYHNPPEKAVVLCVDEKSQMQALDRSQPVLPMMPGMPERRTHDYARHGITSLFAAFNIADGTVITELHRQHRAVEFKKFLIAIDKAVPAELDVHLICDNLATHKTPAINDWLAKHPRFHMHFTPTGSSWINQVERWFGFLTDQLLRRGVHKSVAALENDVRDWITAWNDDPKPFVWTKTAEEILDSLAKYIARISGAGH